MPLERFYRLPDEKQKAIRLAAMKEFARVPIDKVSINKIIQEADISRGSFYTYFEDKWDMLRYIFEDGQEQMRRFCVENLDRSQGDLWEMLKVFQDHIIKFISQNETFEFIKNIMAHSSSEDMFSGFHSKVKPCDGKDELELWLYENTDKSDFKSQDFEEFHHFLMIVMSSMAIGVKEFYLGKPEEKIKKEFAKTLELLRYGVCFK